MYVIVKGGNPTDWYSSHTGIRYKVVSEGHDDYLVESNAMGQSWRIIKKDDCEKESFCDEVKAEQRPDSHYDNTNGSLYKFAEDQELNAWEFDIIKRITRCRKKGQFKDDLEKTKRVIDLYLKEFISL